ncbi:MAG: nitroreductase family protein [Aquabacterium sp.]
MAGDAAERDDPAPGAGLPPALAVQLQRRSLGPRHLLEPGPDDAALALMARAALRAPDHAELVPYRFVVVRGAARDRLAQLFETAARRAGKDDAGAQLDAQRALRAPVTVALLARIDMGHPIVPAHEQWVAVGAALGGFMQAAHALGYGGKMLSGAKVRDPAVQAAFCRPGETLVGWLALGSPAGAVPQRGHEKAAPGDVIGDWG